MLVGPVAPALVETDTHEEDAEEEDADGDGVGLPVYYRVHGLICVEVAEVVCEHVEESMERHQLPISFQELDVREVDVRSGHHEGCRVQDDHVNDDEALEGRESCPLVHVEVLDDHWSEDHPEREGDREVDRVRHLEPREGHDVPVVGVLSREHRQDLRDDRDAPAPVGPEVEVIQLLALVRHDGDQVPEEMGDEEAESHPEEEI